MCKKICIRKFLMLVTCLYVLLLLSACGATLKHVPSQSLNGIPIQKPVSVMVADIGDERDGESPNRIGQGVSYWLPISYYARDEEGKDLPVSYYIAQSLSEDLGKLGYKTKLANDVKVRTPLSLEESIATAKKEGMDQHTPFGLDGVSGGYEKDSQKIKKRIATKTTIIVKKHSSTSRFFALI